jgi:hypothetical protein
VSTDIRDRVLACREAILSSQLADGAVIQVGYSVAGKPAYVEPYFANLACLGLLAARLCHREARTLPFIRRWLEWYADHQEPDGTIPRYDGFQDANRNLVNYTEVGPDSHDSYAGSYLAVAAAYTRASHNRPSRKIIQACRRCMGVLARCRSGTDGFYHTLDPAPYPPDALPAQYLLDNLEVHQGLVAARVYFSGIRDVATAAEAASLAADLANRFHLFWYPQQAHFVSLLADKGSVVWGGQLHHVEELANVSALAFLDHLRTATRTGLWNMLMSTRGESIWARFELKDYTMEDPTIERVYFAALRAAPPSDQEALFQKLLARTDNCLGRSALLQGGGDDSDPYPGVHRYGMLIQALLAQPDLLPAYLPKVPLDPAQAP